MRSFLKKLAAFGLFFNGLLISTIMAQDTDPTNTILETTSAKVKVYKLALSSSAECTNPTVVFENAAGIEYDLVAKPTLGKGKIAAGTYRCVIVELSKILNTAATNPCTTAKNNSICADTQQSKLADNSNVTCSGGTGNDQKVALYFTTLSATSTGNRVFLPPTSSSDTTSGVTLSKSIVFPTNKKGAFKISKSIVRSDNCNLEPITYTLSIE